MEWTKVERNGRVQYEAKVEGKAVRLIVYQTYSGGGHLQIDALDPWHANARNKHRHIMWTDPDSHLTQEAAQTAAEKWFNEVADTQPAPAVV